MLVSIVASLERRPGGQVVVLPVAEHANLTVHIETPPEAVIIHAQTQRSKILVERATSPIRWDPVSQETQTEDFDHRILPAPKRRVTQGELTQFLRVQRFASDHNGKPIYRHKSNR